MLKLLHIPRIILAKPTLLLVIRGALLGSKEARALTWHITGSSDEGRNVFRTFGQFIRAKIWMFQEVHMIVEISNLYWSILLFIYSYFPCNMVYFHCLCTDITLWLQQICIHYRNMLQLFIIRLLFKFFILVPHPWYVSCALHCSLFNHYNNSRQ
jgi:hypothetical protein